MKTVTSIISPSLLKFIENVSPEEMNERLLSGASKGVAVIACSEVSEIDAGFPSGRELPIYFWQNLGACVCDCTGLEAIVSEKGITDIIVFGHFPCEVVEIGLRSDFENPAFSKKLQEHFEFRTSETRRSIEERFGKKFDKDVLFKATEDFVLRQLARLLELPAILDAAENNGLKAHAWIMQPEVAKITSLDPEKRLFVPVERPLVRQLGCQVSEN